MCGRVKNYSSFFSFLSPDVKSLTFLLFSADAKAQRKKRKPFIFVSGCDARVHFFLLKKEGEKKRYKIFKRIRNVLVSPDKEYKYKVSEVNKNE